jgi:hypothetical protein
MVRCKLAINYPDFFAEYYYCLMLEFLGSNLVFAYVLNFWTLFILLTHFFVCATKKLELLQ